jgi:hypothetical protein
MCLQRKVGIRLCWYRCAFKALLQLNRALGYELQYWPTRQVGGYPRSGASIHHPLGPMQSPDQQEWNCSFRWLWWRFLRRYFHFQSLWRHHEAWRKRCAPKSFHLPDANLVRWSEKARAYSRLENEVNSLLQRRQDLDFVTPAGQLMIL